MGGQVIEGCPRAVLFVPYITHNPGNREPVHARLQSQSVSFYAQTSSWRIREYEKIALGFMRRQLPREIGRAHV